MKIADSHAKSLIFGIGSALLIADVKTNRAPSTRWHLVSILERLFEMAPLDFSTSSSGVREAGLSRASKVSIESIWPFVIGLEGVPETRKTNLHPQSVWAKVHLD
jgi:hypothetical protein